MFGSEDVTFLTGNNSVLLAHQGSTITLSCRLTKTPNFGMVNNICSKSWDKVLPLGDLVQTSSHGELSSNSLNRGPSSHQWSQISYCQETPRQCKLSSDWYFLISPVWRIGSWELLECWAMTVENINARPPHTLPPSYPQPWLLLVTYFQWHNSLIIFVQLLTLILVNFDRVAHLWGY